MGTQRANGLQVRTSEEQKEIDRLRTLVQKLSLTIHGLSHDLREPIRTVGCYAEILGGSEAVRQDPNLVESVHFIRGAAQRMNALVKGLLDYSRLIEEEPEAPTPVDMNFVVQTALANLQMKVDESGAAIACDTLPPVMGDAVHLTELVQNLLSNSVKYRGAAPPQIFIRCERVGDEQLFSIEDNGMGISPEACNSIFEPFKRLHGQDVPGAGLGLTICRQIVERHRGRIWVESVPGRAAPSASHSQPQPPEQTMETQTSPEFRTCPLYRHAPELFQTFVANYGELIELSVREAVSGTDRQVFSKLRRLARRAGEQDALPQDMIAVHLAALSNLVKTRPQAMVRAGIRLSRLLLVKMIGELALYYRERAAAKP